MKTPRLEVYLPPKELAETLEKTLSRDKRETKVNALGRLFLPEGSPITLFCKPEGLRAVDRLANTGRISDSEAIMLRIEISSSVLEEMDLPQPVLDFLHKGQKGGASILGVNIANHEGKAKTPSNTRDN